MLLQNSAGQRAHVVVDHGNGGRVFPQVRHTIREKFLAAPRIGGSRLHAVVLEYLVRVQVQILRRNVSVRQFKSRKANGEKERCAVLRFLDQRRRALWIGRVAGVARRGQHLFEGDIGGGNRACIPQLQRSAPRYQRSETRRRGGRCGEVVEEVCAHLSQPVQVWRLHFLVA